MDKAGRMGKSFTSYLVEERSFVAYIKREIRNEVVRCNFSEKQAGEIDIIVSELCSNLIKHAGSGELLYRTVCEDGNSSFEIVCFDKGPGMADTKKMMKDGVSTTQTLGQGLGAIERLSTVAQLYSIPGWGTIHYSKVDSTRNTKTEPNGIVLDIRALFINKPREVVCGDGYQIKNNITETQIFFGDGLGHGIHAKEAVDRAGEFFFASKENNPVEILREIHEGVRRTRGLVACVAVLNKVSNEWRICGIGNILARMYTGIMYKNYMSYNGTVGLNIPNTMNNSVLPAEKNQHLILCSDGLRTRWDITKYPSVMKYDTTVLAAALYKDFSRGSDDTSILIAKVI